MLLRILGKLKSELKNQKKVVDKNVPLNRLGLKSQDWLIEPDLEGLTDNFKPLHLSKNKGWRVGAGKSAPALIMITQFFLLKCLFEKQSAGRPFSRARTQTFMICFLSKKKIFAPPLTYTKNHFFENRLGTLINFTEPLQDFALRGGFP